MLFHIPNFIKNTIKELIAIILSVFLLFPTALSIKAFASQSFQDSGITQSSKYAGLVINPTTGAILYAKNINAPRHPASLTKMMTLYVVFDLIKKGKLSMKQKIVISKHAASMPPSNMRLKPGESITVRDAIYALIVRSANDVSVALSEYIAGSESKFIAIMNSSARKLGLKDTIFKNPHGLPHNEQVTTAHDMAILAMALQQHHHAYYHMFAKTSFIYKGNVIKGHNRVLQRHKWVDGIKTGYIKASGFNIVTAANKPEGKLIAVVMGGATAKIRDKHVVDLLQRYYSKINNNNIKSPQHKKINTAESIEKVYDTYKKIPSTSKDLNIAKLSLQNKNYMNVSRNTSNSPFSVIKNQY